MNYSTMSGNCLLGQEVEIYQISFVDDVDFEEMECIEDQLYAERFIY